MVLKSALDRGIRQRGGNPGATAAKTAKAAGSAAVATAKPKPAATAAVPAPAAAPKKKKSSKPKAKTGGTANDEKFQAVLRVVSEESGVALDELTDESNFVDMGIDSLSSMVIGSRMREDLGMEDLAADFSLFIDCPTVAALRVWLGASPGAEGDGDEEEEDEEEQGYVAEPVTASTQPSPATAATTASPVAELGAVFDGEQFNAALKVISEESGVALDELTAETVFSDIGIDSLSSMVISSRFREELGLGLDTAFSLFDDVPSVAKLAAFLGGTVADTSGAVSSESSSEPESPGHESTTTSPPNEAEAADETYAVQAVQRKPFCRPCNSVILQGLPRVAKKTLFMLPDGGGSASSYVPIPRLKADVAVVGLNCPYARDPENMDCTHQTMIAAFATEIRRRQPQGPYHLGGWSSGGAFAYVVAEELVNQGHEVGSLIIIDAPVPQVMEKLPDSFYQHCNSIGLFANQPGAGAAYEPPSYLIPHFQAVVDVMLNYQVAPLKTARMPKVGLIWAADTVLDEGNAPKMKGMHFMVQKRTDFGPDGWDGVLPGAEFDIVRATGANHFTLMVSLFAEINLRRVREC